jgi:Probable Zinc-ribbon domain
VANRVGARDSTYWVSGYPRLVAEWHQTRNGDLRPEDVSYGSSARVWWKCSAGPDHEWAATPNARTSLGNGCPFCAGRRASVTNTLAARFPSIAAEWHPSRNGTSPTPEQIVSGSTRLVWWKCAAGDDHVWSSTPRERTRDLSGCPFCNNARVSRENSLAVVAPELAAEWEATRNEAAACDVVAGSSLRAWWRCARDPSHEWCATIATRVRQRSGCPFCAGKRVTPDRSLAHRAPEVAVEWHPTRNAPPGVHEVAAGSNRRVWWRCVRGHEWQATVGSRAGVRRTGCAKCARERG